MSQNKNTHIMTSDQQYRIYNVNAALLLFQHYNIVLFPGFTSPKTPSGRLMESFLCSVRLCCQLEPHDCSWIMTELKYNRNKKMRGHEPEDEQVMLLDLYRGSHIIR